MACLWSLDHRPHLVGTGQLCEQQRSPGARDPKTSPPKSVQLLNITLIIFFATGAEKVPLEKLQVSRDHFQLKSNPKWRCFGSLDSLQFWSWPTLLGALKAVAQWQVFAVLAGIRLALSTDFRPMVTSFLIPVTVTKAALRPGIVVQTTNKFATSNVRNPFSFKKPASFGIFDDSSHGI